MEWNGPKLSYWFLRSSIKSLLCAFWIVTSCPRRALSVLRRLSHPSLFSRIFQCFYCSSSLYIIKEKTVNLTGRTREYCITELCTTAECCLRALSDSAQLDVEYSSSFFTVTDKQTFNMKQEQGIWSTLNKLWNIFVADGWLNGWLLNIYLSEYLF